MITPISSLESMQIGTVDFVSPDELKVLLDIDAPNDVALNSGTPRPFPRINNYVLVSCEGGFLVAQIEWITIERSQYPKRKGIQDFGIIDLPYPLRKMSIMPLGMLKEYVDPKNQQGHYLFSRGIEMFPTVGDPVIIPSQKQLKAIVESGSNRRIDIGVSPIAGNAIVSIDPDRLFGRHLAILGNTGSGKSCSVAGIIRWSVEKAQKATGSSQSPNTRFIILDPNGEYSKAFTDLPNTRVYNAEVDNDKDVKQLTVPLWLWNSDEWTAFTQASGKAQKPTLIQALRAVRDGQLNVTRSKSHDMRNYLRTLVSISTMEYKAGSPWGKFPLPENFYENITKWEKALEEDIEYSQEENNALNNVRKQIDTLVTPRKVQYANYTFSKQEVMDLMSALKEAHLAFGGGDEDFAPLDADIPRFFNGADLIRSIEATAELMNTTEYIETMLVRIKTLLSDSKLRPVISPDSEISLQTWIENYLCPSGDEGGAITIIDLSLLPVELIHIVTAVISRLILEALQRYRKISNGKILPTTLVMEEAHTFIKRYSQEDSGNATTMCSRVFEKIAREGRKYGLGLILSSQRPSELSPTVLSQCNSFLLHRITNDRDQELVGKLVPDNLRGLLRELPSLPSRDAILLGWASELPVIVRMNYLKEDNRPQSNDPKYWKEWTENTHSINWGDVSKDWTRVMDERQDIQNISPEIIDP